MTDFDHSFLRLDRLRVMARGKPVYDQEFHAGVNIIRGENSVGKSTIADFIFFILGGEFKEWKPATARVEEVQAQISTPRGKLSLRREKVEGRPPVWVYFGDIEAGGEHGIEGWEKYPIYRGQSNLSFTEVLFRSMLLPEAQSDGASNITSHQLMRLLYSDQRTPAPRLFRFESFDKATIRTAVGDLICGIRGFGLFEVELSIRELESKFAAVDSKWSALLNSFPDQIGVTVSAIESEIDGLENKKRKLTAEIEGVDDAVSSDQNASFFKDRKQAIAKLQALRQSLATTSRKVESSKLEQMELKRFIDHLTQSLLILESAERTAQVLGSIEFSHCPSCLQTLSSKVDDDTCHLCGQEIDQEVSASRYNYIRVDIELQIKESRQLLAQELQGFSDAKRHYGKLQGNYEQLTAEFALKFEMSNSPREAFLAERYSAIGRIDKELEQLRRSIQRATELDELSAEKERLNADLTRAKDQRTALQKAATRRRSSALRLVSSKAAAILRMDDSGAQEEFKVADHVDLSFEDDAILLDGLANFSESSNVFLKNAAILGLHLAACADKDFFHPRFALFDNIEDKGMTPSRSHRFQELIVKLTTETPLPNQVIFTTSMMNPELELDDYVIGPHYTEDNKTLDFG
ncbi:MULTISPECIES: AAA family ATPase [Rhodobacterales]|uniref:Rad50/SbcC-type AAA domain-containing protein n=2 Tax=Paracoccaceae TaxID=31989 RepID=A0A2G8RFG8_9RHOB|nr:MULTISPECIES: AAA family ATPase [Paracoccaceae]KAA0910145.1 AAA family ATPase [Aquicoccus porphyridii]MBS4009995.1 AAA family ATPase [Roseovarius sp.]PIL19818.1 hypothetical protein P775_12725 [Puniceibacterium antarcticum]RAI52152.1 hypothetical protein DOO74_19040 [Rhodobacteraceae bacterium AsT-22]